MEHRQAVLGATGVGGIWSGGMGVEHWWMCSGVVDKSVGWEWVWEPSGDGIWAGERNRRSEDRNFA